MTLQFISCVVFGLLALAMIAWLGCRNNLTSFVLGLMSGVSFSLLCVWVMFWILGGGAK